MAPLSMRSAMANRSRVRPNWSWAIRQSPRTIIQITPNQIQLSPTATQPSLQRQQRQRVAAQQVRQQQMAFKRITRNSMTMPRMKVSSNSSFEIRNPLQIINGKFMFIHVPTRHSLCATVCVCVLLFIMAVFINCLRLYPGLLHPPPPVAAALLTLIQ